MGCNASFIHLKGCFYANFRLRNLPFSVLLAHCQHEGGVAGKSRSSATRDEKWIKLKLWHKRVCVASWYILVSFRF